VHAGSTTLYTRCGDWLPWVLLAASVVGIGTGIARRAKLRRGQREPRRDAGGAASRD
jgi:hypothetical protein